MNLGERDREHLLAASFRASPAYELVPFERLSPADREALQSLCRSTDFYGVLRPRTGRDGAVHSVDCDTALLVATLAQAGPLPSFVTRKLGEAAHGVVARLVLDGLLEMATEAGWLSGPAAHARLLDEPAADLGKGRLARLSLDALRYASDLGLTDALALARRLYLFNATPASPRLRNRFVAPGTLWNHVCPPASRLARLLDDAWIALTKEADASPWRCFRHRDAPRATDLAPTVVHKLYVSPAFDALSEVFGAALVTFTELGVVRFKIGKSLEGVLRPDKIVAYFSTFDALANAAERLRRVLDGCSPQGVPFSAAIDPGGLLSWGLDPPHAQDATTWMGRESWRFWVTRRLAAALVAARQLPAADVAPWRFALDRVRLEGFDTRSWTPSARIWNDASPTELHPADGLGGPSHASRLD